jgi:hypothetical protein
MVVTSHYTVIGMPYIHVYVQHYLKYVPLVRTMVPVVRTSVRTINGTMILTYVHVLPYQRYTLLIQKRQYHGTRTRVPWYVHVYSEYHFGTYTYPEVLLHVYRWYHVVRTCLRGLWWRSALQTSLSSWNLNCSIPWCLLCWQCPLASVPVAPECLYFKLFLR